MKSYKRDLLPLEGAELNSSYEPLIGRLTVDNYLSKVTPELGRSYIYIMIYGYVAHILCSNRVQISSRTIKGSRKTTFPNLYITGFADSGKGKDTLAKELRSVFFKQVNEELKLRYDIWRKKRLDELKAEAAESIDPESSNKGDIGKYVASKAPREYSSIFSSGTREGLIDMRNSMDQAGFLCATFMHSEYVDFVRSGKSENMELIDFIKEAYEGSNDAKLIKTEKSAKSVESVPMNMIVHSASFNEEEMRKIFPSLLEGGAGRRNFFPIEIDQKKPLPEEFDVEINSLEDGEENIYQESERVKALAFEIYKQTSFGTTYEDGDSFIHNTQPVIMKLEDEADMLMKVYQKSCKAIADSFENTKLGSLIATEHRGRNWKALKLSACVAAFEHPNDLSVKLPDVQFAIHLTEVLGSQFQLFIKNDLISHDYDKLFDFLEKNLNKGFLRRQLYQQSFVPRDKGSEWISKAVEYVQDMVEETDYTFVQEQVPPRGIKVMLCKKSPTQPDTVTISLSTDNKGIYSKSFETQTIEFEKLPELLTTKQYSHLIWNEGQRHSDNFLPGFDMIVLDVDSQTTLQEAVDTLEQAKLLSMLITTPNHQKEKNGALTDRFRIILPLAYKFTGDISKYKACMTGLVDKLGINVDRQGFDAARHFRASPKTAQIEWVAGAKLDLDKYYKPQPKKVSSNIVSGKPTDPKLNSLYKAWSTTITKEAVPGNRNNAFSKVAFWMKDEGVSKLDAESFLKQENSRLTDSLPEREIDTIIRSKW